MKIPSQKKKSVEIDHRIKVGMIATLWRNQKRENVHVYKILPQGKRVIVVSPQTKEKTEFSLRKNGCWVKVGDKTGKATVTLTFPELIRRDLIAAFCKF